MKRVTDGVTRIGLGMVNSYLLEAPEALVLIDTGFPKSADEILAAMKQLGHAPDALAHIVLTHAHPDHIGSAAALVRATGAQTWMHRVDVPIAEHADQGLRPVHPMPGLLPRLLFTAMGLMPQKVEPVRIDHVIEDGDVLPFGGLRAIHAPGHCAGQVALLWPDRHVLFAADTCMNLFRLRQPLVNEDEVLSLRSVQNVSTFDFDTACFGHGNPIVREADRRFREVFGGGPRAVSAKA
jgi:glyoxylase-like metal-dependent hydrolase (beta-lactamase superfamily II)